MAVSVKQDLVRGAQVTKKNGQYSSATVIYNVSGLTNTASSDLAEACFNRSEIPKYGDPYPKDSFLRVTDIQWNSNGQPGGGQVIVTYGQIRAGSSGQETTQYIAGGTRTVSVTTTRDRNGDKIECPAPSIVSDINEKNEPQPTSITVDETQDVLRVTRIIATQQPGVITRRFGNKVNNIAFLGDPPGTWRCVDAAFAPYSYTNDGLVAEWEFTFEFQYKESEWLPIVYYWDDQVNRMDKRVVYRRTDKDGNPLGLGDRVYDGAKAIAWYYETDLNQIFTI